MSQSDIMNQYMNQMAQQGLAEQARILGGVNAAQISKNAGLAGREDAK